ncbi:MAG: hypothetical protein LUC43_09370 [Burkholderiales bacterium]|nr:hypothetical protein [Burkholderiales bacterium]
MPVEIRRASMFVSYGRPLTIDMNDQPALVLRVTGLTKHCADNTMIA